MVERIPEPANLRSLRRVRDQGVAAVPPGEQKIAVADALAMPAGVGVVEIYVDWSRQPVHVSSRGRGSGQNWESASTLLRERVSCAIQPLIAAGWRVEGTLFAAMRWDTSHADIGQNYDGCWVRMRLPRA
jgi:hypothetical protein